MILKSSVLMLSFAASLWIQPSMALDAGSVTGSPPLQISGEKIAQQTTGQPIEITGRLRPAEDGNGWDVVAGNQRYHIENPSPWDGEDWFDSDSTVHVTGHLKPDTARATVVASNISHVRTSEIRNIGDRVQEEIEKQLSEERLRELLRRIPFLDRIFD